MSLPPELILDILSFLVPTDAQSIPTLVACRVVSRAFGQISTSSSLWTPHALSRWTRGSPPSSAASSYDYYVARARSDAIVQSHIATLARTTHGRIRAIETIRQLGEDALDVLGRLREIVAEDEPEYWLSVRHWASEASEAIWRDGAVDTWRRIAREDDEGNEGEQSFEDGMLAFTAFRGSDPEKVRQKFDDLMIDITPLCHHSLENPKAALLHITKAVTSGLLAAGLRPADGEEYHNLNNHFLSEVFADAASSTPRGTLPMSLVAIFCSLIRRLPLSLNVQAKPVGFPGILLAVVSPRDNSTEPIYVSVFDGGKVLTSGEMREMVARMGIPMEDEYLSSASAKDMCHRVARNILHSVRTRNQEGTPSALYATARACFQFAPPPTTAYAGWLSTLIQSPEFSLDVGFLESEELRSKLGSEEKVDEVASMCESIREADAEPRERRETSDEIRWKIGHVFIHRLFGYVAVVRGFDVTCKADENWIQQMHVDSLPHGRNQPFYHVTCSDGMKLYVASENIQTLDVPVHRYDDLTKVRGIGLFFRRLGRVDGRPGFIKSVELEAEYPDM